MTVRPDEWIPFPCPDCQVIHRAYWLQIPCACGLPGGVFVRAGVCAANPEGKHMHASPRDGARRINIHFNNVDATGATFADAMVKGDATVPVNVYADGLKTSNDSVIFEL